MLIMLTIYSIMARKEKNLSVTTAVGTAFQLTKLLATVSRVLRIYDILKKSKFGLFTYLISWLATSSTN
jgi:hypothetical protein